MSESEWETLNEWEPVVTPQDHMRYAAREIEGSNAQLDAAKSPRLSAGATQQVINKYRAAAGLKPYESAYEIFQKTRKQRTEDSAWDNFLATTASIFARQAGGLTKVGYKVSDTLGITDDALETFAGQMDTAEKVWAADPESWSGRAGQLVGTTMFSLMFGLGGKGTTFVRGAAKEAALRSGAKVGAAFGLSAAGEKFADVAQRRKRGQDISTAAEWTAALGHGAVEAATEMFGWAIARGLATKLLKHTPGLRNIVATRGVKAGIEATKKFLKTAVGATAKQMPAGFAEEASAEFGGFVIDKLLEITPEVPWKTLPGRMAEAGAMGAAQPLLLGGAQAGGLMIQTHQAKQRWTARLQAMPDDGLLQTQELLKVAEERGQEVDGWVHTELQQEIDERRRTSIDPAALSFEEFTEGVSPEAARARIGAGLELGLQETVTPRQLEATRTVEEEAELGLQLRQGLPGVVTPSQLQEGIAEGRERITAARQEPGIKAPIEPGVTPAGEAMVETSAEVTAPVPVSTELPDEIRLQTVSQGLQEAQAVVEEKRATLSSASNASGVEDIPDGIPEKSIYETVTEFLSDETGAIPVDQLGRVLTGGLEGAAEEVKVLGGGIRALVLDASAPLRQSDAGIEALGLLDEAEARHRAVRGPLLGRMNQAFQDMSLNQRREVRAWMFAMRPDGDTNWKTLIEHPERVQEMPDGVELVLATYQTMQELTGVWAENARVPQLRRVQEGEKIEFKTEPFKRAKGGRYFRIFNAEGLAMFRYQSGKTWDALLDWMRAHPDRNPGLDPDATDFRERLQGMRQTGTTKKAGSLEFVRIFDELPVALEVDGEWVPIQLRDPRSHFVAALEGQSRRVAFWSTMQEFLTPRYGTFNEETGRTEYHKPKTHTDLTDVDGLIDRLRKDIVTQSSNPRQAEQTFNRALDNYSRSNSGGLMEEFMVSFGDSKLAQVATAVDRTVTSSVLTLAPLWDAFNPARSAAGAGWTQTLKGYGSALVSMLTQPTKFAAEYQALGAVIDGHADWSVHRDSWFRDIFVKNIPQALMAAGRFSEKRSQFTIARIFDRWTQQLNRQEGLSSADAAYLKNDLRLMDHQVAEIARGEMTEATRAKILQNAVNIVAGLTEAQFRKGVIQTHPMGRFAFRFLSVVNAVARAGVQHTADLAADIKQVADTSLTQKQRASAANKAASSAWRMLSFVAAIAGSGFLQKYARRAVTGRPLIDPEDSETWYGALSEALAEGGIFGPFYRIFEAAKYSNDNLAQMITNLIFPLGVVTEISSAILGLEYYEGTPWDRRLESLGTKYTPAYKAGKNWYSRVLKPQREEYFTVRRMVRKFNKDEGIEHRQGAGPRNYHYYNVFEAVRDGDSEAITEAVLAFTEWAKSEGWGGEKARRGLQSSLRSRRPISVTKEQRPKFLLSLTAAQRKQAEAVDRTYSSTVDRITRRPGMRVRPTRPTQAKPKRPGEGGDWYGSL